LTSVGAAIAHVRYHTFINGVLSGNIQIDTTQVPTDTAMNRGGDASKRALLKAKDIEMFANPKPETCALKKSPIPLRA